MILKTTLNQLHDFFSNNIQKTILFSSSFLEKKIWSLLFEISGISVSGINSTTTFMKSAFDVHQTEKNGKFKGTPPEGMYYILYVSIY
ncbi:hypothetical protein CLU83_1426 [Flavobacterium sp. 1]|uniref:hypothetical protein n=1 Tax=Flavobacterium sp. 1 TaxID=2035200 RepID=UPI000C23844F|nr:hypothetical protein [Flavobacterium sp. 1]PJJ08179.1 hypothetical protein CLU83_1426 [Flavobacterium sp. 1]